MHDNAPTVYLLAGPASVGARRYANLLAVQGVIRLEPADRDALADHVDAGRDVVLESEAADREHDKRLVEEHGGQWCVIHFSDDHLDTVQRLRARAAQA